MKLDLSVDEWYIQMEKILAHREQDHIGAEHHAV